MNIFILFGITGDLAKKKVIPALADLEKRGGSSTGEQLCIGIGRKPVPPAEFHLLKRGLYIAGELDAASTYKKLRKALYAAAKESAASRPGSRISLMAYSSLPPHMHVMVAEMLAKWTIDEKANKKLGAEFRFLLEKPVGTDLASATRDIEALERHMGKDCLYFVDHYLFKEPLTALRDAAALCPRLFAESIGGQGIRTVEAVIHESIGIEGRGAFYDAVGALSDIGQNHIAQMLAEFIRIRDAVRSACAPAGSKPVAAKTRGQIISSLKLVNNPVFGQYKGYAESEGVKKGSKTETFFRIEAICPGSGGTSDIKCVLSGGKGLGVKKSGLIIRDQTHGTETFIDMNTGKKDAYVAAFEQAILGNRAAFADQSEIIAGWKLVKRAKQIRTRANIVYGDLHDIIHE